MSVPREARAGAGRRFENPLRVVRGEYSSASLRRLRDTRLPLFRTVFRNSVQRLGTIGMHEPPGVDSHGPEREKRDWRCPKSQRSADTLASVHVNRGQPKEKGYEKN